MSLNLTSSIWATPMKLKRWNIDDQLKPTILYCALSSTYAYNIGCRLTMHCEPELYDILKLMPYAKIYTDIDSDKLMKSIKHVSPLQFWASSKSVAFEKEGTGVIHIDNDVFLTDPVIIDALDIFKENSKYDVIFQHIENGVYAHEKKAWANIIDNVDWNTTAACCVGVLGFNNEKLLETYLNNYKYWKENLTLDENLSKNTCADLICEQKYLYKLITEDGYNGKSLLGDYRIHSVLQLQQHAEELGYYHIIGPPKYNEVFIKRQKRKLMKLNPSLYEKIQQYI